jgi:hypothetical protein
MYASKAWAGVVGFVLASLVKALLLELPGWPAINADIREPLTWLLCGTIVWAMVYVAPPNRYEDVSMPPR